MHSWRTFLEPLSVGRDRGREPYARYGSSPARCVSMGPRRRCLELPDDGSAAGGANPARRRFMGIMAIIGTIIVGFIVGVLARFFYPGAVPMGFWLTVALGIGGSLVGGVVGSLIWKSPDGKFHPAGWFLSLLGALLLLWLYINFFQK